MLRTVILAACFCALACLSPVAEARPKSSLQKMQIAQGCSDPVMRPCGVGSEIRSFSKEIAKKRLWRRHFMPDLGRKEITHHNASMLNFSTSFEAAKINMAMPTRYIAGRLVCAINVNAELARRGIRGTGSALAKSFLHWGRPSRPVAGAVAVYGRKGGGHVAIVSRVVGGRVYVWNPSSRAHRWREVEYRRRAIAYRVAAQ